MSRIRGVDHGNDIFGPKNDDFEHFEGLSFGIIVAQLCFNMCLEKIPFQLLCHVFGTLVSGWTLCPLLYLHFEVSKMFLKETFRDFKSAIGIVKNAPHAKFQPPGSKITAVIQIFRFWDFTHTANLECVKELRRFFCWKLSLTPYLVSPASFVRFCP